MSLAMPSTWMLGLMLAAGAACPAAAQDVAIVNARVIAAPDAEPLEGAIVLVRDGRIAAVGDSGSVTVPDGTDVIDGAGRTVVAGFWNSHVHLETLPLRHAASESAEALSAALANDYTRWGFTALFDLGTPPGAAIALRKRIERGEVTGPMVLTTDAPFFPQGGLPFYVPEEVDGFRTSLAEVATAEEAVARARDQLARGADGLKIFAGALVGGEVGVLPMDIGIGAAIAGAAHAAGKRVFAHPSNVAGIEVAIDSGADVLAHSTPVAGPWPDGLAQRLVEEGIALVPSLKLFEVELGKEDAPQAAIDRILSVGREQVTRMSEAGGVILFGTDSGYVDWYDTRDELSLMHAAGLDWRQILASLTTAPAGFFGHGDRKGRVAEGMDADLVVLAGDPTAGIEAFSEVRYTIRGGRIIHRADGE